MTDDRLTQICERFDAIIPGPWRWYGNTETDQVALATTNRGRLFIMDTHLHHTEYVFHHEDLVSYTLEEARERVINWCGAHDEGSDPTFRESDCRCDSLRDFLAGEADPLNPETRHWTSDGLPGATRLARGVRVGPDLRFPDRSLGEARKEHGGMMRSYRESPRYEVLDYRTREEYERQTGKKAETALYREDFCGLAQPEATFIEHAAEDIDYLLRRLDAAEQALAAAREWGSAAMAHNASQWAHDASQETARAVLAWEEVAGP